MVGNNKGKNMKKLILAVFVGTCVVVQAKMSPYVSVYGGGSGLQNTDFTYKDSSDPSNNDSGELKYDVGGVGGAAIGTSLGSSIPVRIEVEYSYRKNDINGRGVLRGNMKTTSWMVNLYYDFKNVDGLYDYLSGPVFPYVFIGGGTMDLEVKVGESGDVPLSASESVFAGQVGIGFGWEITDHIIFDLKGRIVVGEDVDFGVNSTESIDVERPLYAEVLAGLRFQF